MKTVQTEHITVFDMITEHLMKDEKPSEYISNLLEQKEYQKDPFTMLNLLKKTDQSKQHHPEGSVWNHTMLVLDEAAAVRDRSNEPIVFMWAALLHDIGKPATTKIRKGKITSYDHDKEGEKLCIEFMKALSADEDLIRKISSMVRYHMHMLYVLKNLPYADLKGLLKQVDNNDIALLCRCDRMGRTGADRQGEESEYGKFVEILRRSSNKLYNRK